MADWTVETAQNGGKVVITLPKPIDAGGQQLSLEDVMFAISKELARRAHGGASKCIIDSCKVDVA